MNVHSILENGEMAGPEHQFIQPDETERMLETVKGCLQTSLVGESQNFRSSVAAAQKKFRQAQQQALWTVGLSCVLGSVVMLAGIWQAHRVTSQAEARFQSLPGQAVAASPDAFAQLRQENWQPMGKLIVQKGRTFIELKPAN